VWPADWLADKAAYYYLTLALVAAGAAAAPRAVLAPAMRCARARLGAARRRHRHRRQAPCSGRRSSSRAVSPAWAVRCSRFGQHLARELVVGKSVDGLVMVLLGGVQTLAGPVVGAVTFTWLHDVVARNTDYWRACWAASS
jgi:branched-chain amino acid transport system permease protein